MASNRAPTCSKSIAARCDQVFHEFLKGLISEAGGRKVHVLVDNLRVHHAKAIKRWARRYRAKIQLHYLPSYSPDLNPDEYFNCDIKEALAKRPERRTKGHWNLSITHKSASVRKDLPSRGDVAEAMKAPPERNHPGFAVVFAA